MKRRSFVTCFLGATGILSSELIKTPDEEWIDAKKRLPNEGFDKSVNGDVGLAPVWKLDCVWSREVLVIFRYEKDGALCNKWKILRLCSGRKYQKKRVGFFWTEDSHFCAKTYSMEFVTHWTEIPTSVELIDVKQARMGLMSVMQWDKKR